MALNLPYMARVSQTTSQHAEPCTKQVAGFSFFMLPAIDSSTPHPVREVNAHLVVGSETSAGRRQSLDLTCRSTALVQANLESHQTLLKKKKNVSNNEGSHNGQCSCASPRAFRHCPWSPDDGPEI